MSQPCEQGKRSYLLWDMATDCPRCHRLAVTQVWTGNRFLCLNCLAVHEPSVYQEIRNEVGIVQVGPQFTQRFDPSTGRYVMILANGRGRVFREK